MSFSANFASMRASRNGPTNVTEVGESVAALAVDEDLQKASRLTVTKASKASKASKAAQRPRSSSRSWRKRRTKTNSSPPLRAASVTLFCSSALLLLLLSLRRSVPQRRDSALPRLPHAHMHAKRNAQDEILLSPKALCSKD